MVQAEIRTSICVKVLQPEHVHEKYPLTPWEASCRASRHLSQRSPGMGSEFYASLQAQALSKALVPRAKGRSADIMVK
jgi:hypothetical protein